MDHNVNNVQMLYDDALYLHNTLVVGGDASADSILSDLFQGIENLKNNWKGRDAGYRIQEVIRIYNAMVAVRNALSQLAADSVRVAVNYREIQIANGVRDADALSTINVEFKNYIQDYSDTSDTIDISSAAEEGKRFIDSANELLETFENDVKFRYQYIMDNWTRGTGRDSARGAYDLFLANVNKYKQILTDVSSNITKALQNYTF